MKTIRIRFGVVAFVLVVLGAAAWALAAPPPNYYLVKCSKYTCTSPGVCVDPYIGSGYCTQGKNGPGFPANVGCCCCSDADASNRWFHGE